MATRQLPDSEMGELTLSGPPRLLLHGISLAAWGRTLRRRTIYSPVLRVRGDAHDIDPIRTGALARPAGAALRLRQRAHPLCDHLGVVDGQHQDPCTPHAFVDGR